MDPMTITAALLPVVADGVRGLIAKFTGSEGAKPQNVDEAIKLEAARTDRLKALAALDAPQGPVSLWVSNLRASARYIAVFAVIAYGVFVSMTDASPLVVANAQQLMSSAFFFLFGDRVYLSLKSGEQRK